jgi:endonuclease VIII
LPEGDTIFRAAQTLHKYMAGKVVTRFESVLPALTRVAFDTPVIGRTIDAVRSRGKHLLFEFSGDLVLRTHMRMNGSWHIYPAGARWKRPLRDMRIVVGTRDAVAVGFNVPVAEFLLGRDVARNEPLRSLGPDLLDPAFDRDEALRRMRARNREPICDVLLDQRVLAGIGNVFKSEILHEARVNPFTPTAAIDDAALDRVVDAAVRLLHANVLSRRQTLSPAVGRRTTRSLDPDEKLWVYGRAGKPCRRCGTRISSRSTGLDARLTFWCPVCQPGKT